MIRSVDDRTSSYFKVWKPVAGSVVFARRRIAVVLVYAYERGQARAACELVLECFHVVRKHILVVYHRIDPEIFGCFETEVSQHIVAFVPGTGKCPGLIGITCRHVVTGPIAAAVDGQVMVLCHAGVPEHILVMVVGKEQLRTGVDRVVHRFPAVRKQPVYIFLAFHGHDIVVQCGEINIVAILPGSCVNPRSGREAAVVEQVVFINRVEGILDGLPG
jgi:hypothetical protein